MKSRKKIQAQINEGQNYILFLLDCFFIDKFPQPAYASMNETFEVFEIKLILIE